MGRLRDDGLALIRGRVLNLSEAQVPIRDRGYLLGDGIFETMRTEAGRVFELDRHFERLRRGLAALGLDAPVAKEAKASLLGFVDAATARFGPRLYVRLQISTGLGEDYAGVSGHHEITAIARPLRLYPASHYQKGIRVVVGRIRKPRQGPLVGVKSLSSLAHVAARREARDQRAEDALLLNDAGRVSEATTSNVVAVHEGRLWAPGLEEGALDGVTRALVLDWADAQGVRWDPVLPLERLLGAEEVFLTNTIGGIVPVASLIEPSRSFDGPRGTLTRRMKAAYEARLASAERAATDARRSRDA